MVSESRIEVLAKETGLQLVSNRFLLVFNTPQKPWFSRGIIYIYIHTYIHTYLGPLRGVSYRGMGLQLILNVEARKIEGYATQSNVPGPVVNLSLLATGPSLNKNQQAEKLSSLSVLFCLWCWNSMLLLPISPAKMRQDTDNPIICWLSSNFMVVQYQRSNIVG